MSKVNGLRLIRLIHEQGQMVTLEVNFDRKSRECDCISCKQKIHAGMVAIIVSGIKTPSKPRRVFCSKSCYEKSGGINLLTLMD